jgi:hypothetical protein
MARVKIFDLAYSVKVEQYGYSHNTVVSGSLHSFVDFFLEKDIQVMILKPNHLASYDYVLCVDNGNFRQR